MQIKTKINFTIILLVSLFITMFIGLNDDYNIILTTEQQNKINKASDSIKSSQNNYLFIWDELEDAPGYIHGDDIIFWGESFGPYHNYTEIVSKIQECNNTYPEFVDIFSIGKTFFGRDIWCVKITNESNTTEKRQLLIDAQHHAREQITVENALYTIDKLVEQATNGNESVIKILNEKEIFIIPSLNIDGASIIHINPWHRKTLRPIDENNDGELDTYNDTNILNLIKDVNQDGFIDFYQSDRGEALHLGLEGYDVNKTANREMDVPGGVDPNRNYDWDFNNTAFSSLEPRSLAFNGLQPFSENCTRVYNSFIQEHYFELAVTLHSGTIATFVPNVKLSNAKANTTEGKNNEVAFVTDVSRNLSQITNAPRDIYRQGSGKFTGFMYWTQPQIKFSVTMETYGNDSSYNIIDINENLNYRVMRGIWDDFNPDGNKIIDNCEETFKGIYYLLGLDYSFNDSIEEDTDEQKIIGYPVGYIINIAIIAIIMVYMKNRK